MSQSLWEVVVCAAALVALDQWTKGQVRLHAADRALASRTRRGAPALVLWSPRP